MQNKKKDAKVSAKLGEGRFWNHLSFKRAFLSILGLGGWRTLYIKGDFRESLKYARKYKDTDYGGYNLLFNNCLHFVRNALRKGKCSNKLLQLYFLMSRTIVPRVFLNTASIVSKMRITILNKNKILRGYYA